MERYGINKMRLVMLLAILTILFLLSINQLYNIRDSQTFSYNAHENDMKPVIEYLFNTRSNVLVTGNLSILKPMFDLSHKQGRWALEHEVRRVKYLKEWSAKHGIRFINIESTVRVKNNYKKGNILKFALEESYRFDYIYKNDPSLVVNSFGVGIRHYLSLKNKDDRWLICSDWYTDCFEDAMGSYSGSIPLGPVEDNISSDVLNQIKENQSSLGYNRKKAVEYADKYCGAAWGSGNNFKYNRKYADYNGLGGDCTNFISQALTDNEGGGLKQNSYWYPGARSWSNVDGLMDYILNNGRGYIVGKGTYEELSKPVNSTPGGIIARLIKGDIICYVKKGDPDHFAIVTGKDSRGSLLVNSHTTDRYHVPWDLGWGNKNIKFILIHING